MMPFVFHIVLILSLKNVISVDIVHVFNVYARNESLQHDMTWSIFAAEQARRFASERGIHTRLVAAVAQNDARFVPSTFIPCIIDRFVSSPPSEMARKTSLPFVQDVLHCVFKIKQKFDIVILTNSDIMLHEQFYVYAEHYCRAASDCAFTVNRRDINDGQQLLNSPPSKTSFAKMQTLQWSPHPGHDCFVMARAVASCVRLSNLFFGFPPWGTVLRSQLVRLVDRRIWKTVRSSRGLTFHFGAEQAWRRGSNTTGLWAQNVNEWAKAMHTFELSNCHP